MNWQTISDSSIIDAVYYDDMRQDLYIRFKTNAAAYRYRMVPPPVASGFIKSESVGKAFYALIRDQYESEKLS